MQGIAIRALRGPPSCADPGGPQVGEMCLDSACEDDPAWRDKSGNACGDLLEKGLCKVWIEVILTPPPCIFCMGNR